MNSAATTDQNIMYRSTWLAHISRPRIMRLRIIDMTNDVTDFLMACSIYDAMSITPMHGT